MKPIIAKELDGPTLTKEQITQLTNVTFLEESTPSKCDLIFVFSGTHPGHWEKAIEAYNVGLGEKILVTGGVSPTGKKHEDWEDENTPEAEIIKNHLLHAGIPSEAIISENQSRNTLENVLCAKEVFDFNSIQSILFICKAHVAGRQYRTLAQHLPKQLMYIPYTFATTYEGQTISRENWFTIEKGKARVLGEYKRILFYGDRGDILPLDNVIQSL